MVEMSDAEDWQTHFPELIAVSEAKFLASSITYSKVTLFLHTGTLRLKEGQ